MSIHAWIGECHSTLLRVIHLLAETQRAFLILKANLSNTNKRNGYYLSEQGQLK